MTPPPINAPKARSEGRPRWPRIGGGVTATIRSHPQTIRELVTPLVARLTVSKRPSAEEVAASWRRLVGPRAARHSQPTSLRSGELLVAVDTSVWLWNLSLQRHQLLEGLQAAWGAETITAIRLRMR